MHQPARGFEFGVVQDRVERDEDARAVAVRERDELRDLADFIAGVVPCAEAGPADVDRVGPVQDRLAADLGRAGGGKQFKLVRRQARRNLYGGASGRFAVCRRLANPLF